MKHPLAFMRTLTVAFLLATGTLFPGIASADLISDLQAQIAALTAQLNAIIAGTGSSVAGKCTFTRSLTTGSTGDDVMCLQKYLNSAGFPVASSGAGAPGSETTYFGSRTQAAVAKWQAANGVAPTAGYFGPISQAKYNSVVVGTPVPPGTPPASEPTPAPTPVPTPIPPPAPVGPIPTPAELGMPFIDFFGWTNAGLKLQFSHDPKTVTRSYAISLRSPGDTAAVKFGPYELPPAGETKTAADGTSIARLGPTSWEFRKSADFSTSASEGIYFISVRAVGNGEVESTPSPEWNTTLYPIAQFSSLFEGIPLRDVLNNVVTKFPLTIRLSNPSSQFYYRYDVYDGGALIWNSDYIRQSENQNIEAVFTNANGYTFATGKSYRIHVESHDNDGGQDSVQKTRPADLFFTYSPAS